MDADLLRGVLDGSLAGSVLQGGSTYKRGGGRVGVRPTTEGCIVCRALLLQTMPPPPGSAVRVRSVKVQVSARQAKADSPFLSIARP